MPDELYTPVIKAKLGELDAIKELPDSIRSMLQPLVEVTAPTFDYVEGRFERSIDEHLDAVAKRMSETLAGIPRVMIDIPERFDGGGDVLIPSADALRRFFAVLGEAGVHPVPVITPATTPVRREVLDSLHDGPPAIRATLQMLAPDVPAELTALNRLTSGVLARSAPATLIVDLRALEESAHLSAKQWRHLIKGTIQEMMQPRQFDHVAVVGTSFPRDLRDVSPGIDSSLTRSEWKIWESLASSMTSLERYHYGDYPISHPELTEIDPRQMRMSANIRYTAEDHWVLVKGRNVRDYGFGQYRELAQALIGRDEYRGKDYSWGDKFIWDCAHSDGGTGNATTWRKVGTNHHITLVANQLARQADSAEST